MTQLINQGYSALHKNAAIYAELTKSGSYTDPESTELLRANFNEWCGTVDSGLESIFPTELERHLVWRSGAKTLVRHLGVHQGFGDLRLRHNEVLEHLTEVLATQVSRYTDLPLSTRLYVEDIDSFRLVRDVNPRRVSSFLNKNGYLDISEDQVQIGFEQILDASMHKKDWGGETNDLYSTNIVVNGARVASAFLLKGNGLRRKTLEIAGCGKNGDQLVRLMDSPANLFVVQFVGQISENVIRDIDAKVSLLRSMGRDAHYCIIDGQDTARLLLAYGKLAASPSP